MEGGQRIHLGAHAQNQLTVFKAQRSEPEPVPILLRQTAVMNALGWQKRKGSVPRWKMDALVSLRIQELRITSEAKPFA